MQAVSKGLEKVEQELTASENDGAISVGFQKVRIFKGLLVLDIGFVKIMVLCFLIGKDSVAQYNVAVISYSSFFFRNSHLWFSS